MKKKLEQSLPGWTVATDSNLTIALDINITENLKQEGIARELINKIQNIRKESDFSVTDRIRLQIVNNEAIQNAVLNFKEYICNQTLATELDLVTDLDKNDAKQVEVDADIVTLIRIERT